MKTNPNRQLQSSIFHLRARLRAQSGFFNPCILLAFALCLAGVFLAMVGFAANPPSEIKSSFSQQRSTLHLVAEANAALATAAAAAQWSIVASPNIASHDFLRDVACISESDCWAVGYYHNGTVYQTLIEHWNGTGWSIWTSADTSPTTSNYLNAVTCVSTSDCWAVGSESSGQALIEYWDGISWTIVTSPSPSLAVLNDVTCTDANNCWAVGGRWFSTSTTGGVISVTSETLIKHWHDGAWTDEPAPAPGIVLTGIACGDARNCWTVGNYTRGEIISGSIPIPQIQGSGGGGPGPIPPCGLICSFCIGPECGPLRSIYGAIADSINHLVQSHVVIPPQFFTFTISFADAMFERWDGASWSLSSPAIATPESPLLGVTCASASECWAVGAYSNSSNRFQTLIEHGMGVAWTITQSPNTSDTQNNLLEGVSCASASDCWAVGDYYNGFVYQTLIQHWDGNVWTIIASPNANTARKNTLNAVTCASASDCWAVGSYDSGNRYQTLIEHYAVPPPSLVSVVSRKFHDGIPYIPFDVDLPLTGNAGIECRSGGPNGEYQVVMTFAAPVTYSSSAVTSGSGSVSSASGQNTNTVTVNLSGVANAQTIIVTLIGASDGTNTGNVSVPMSVLLGDTTGDGSVNSADIAQTKSQSGQMVGSSNFRQDVTTDGSINSADIALVKSKSGTALP